MNSSNKSIATYIGAESLKCLIKLLIKERKSVLVCNSMQFFTKCPWFPFSFLFLSFFFGVLFANGKVIVICEEVFLQIWFSLDGFRIFIWNIFVIIIVVHILKVKEIKLQITCLLNYMYKKTKGVMGKLYNIIKSSWDFQSNKIMSCIYSKTIGVWISGYHSH